MIIFKTFESLENFYIKFQDFLYFSNICTNPASQTVYSTAISQVIFFIATSLSHENCMISRM